MAISKDDVMVTCGCDDFNCERQTRMDRAEADLYYKDADHILIVHGCQTPIPAHWVEEKTNRGYTMYRITAVV